MSEPTISFAPASDLSLGDLADLFTRSFAEYYYPGITSTLTLARRVRVEAIDLLHSPVLLVDGAPAGLALLARRGPRAWCGGFGVVVPWRGQGLAAALATAMIDYARESEAERLVLEVLIRNERALRVYQRAGMAITRRLLILAWRDEAEPAVAAPEPLEERDPAELVLGHFARLHRDGPAWQRAPAALLSMGGLRGLALAGPEPAAYALLDGDEHGARIVDMGAADAAAAARLIAALKPRARSLVTVNEVAGGILAAAYQRAGFVVADEQYELELGL